MLKSRKWVRYLAAGWLPFGRHFCVLCGNKVWRFMPYRDGSAGVPALMRVLGMIGSNVDKFECPRCGAHDRERHLLMYLDATGLLPALKGQVVLHFAPEKCLSQRILAAGPASYVRCDLHPQSPEEVRVDMLAMEFEPETFDVVIANHVLEHVADDAKALSEVRRVLKVGGYAILQTPYCGKLKRTWEDAGITDGAARLQAYGQEDHVRLYGQDIFDRFGSGHLKSLVQRHAQLLPCVDAAIFGVNQDEPFFLFQRTEAGSTD